MKLLENLLYNLDKIIAYLGLIISLYLIYYLGIELKRIVSLIAIIFVFLICMIYLIYKNKFYSKINLYINNYNIKILTYCYFIVYILSILSLFIGVINYQRPVIYFILLSLMFVIISFEIYFSIFPNKTIILLQIILLCLNIVCSQLLMYPSILGLDPWSHQMFYNKIMDINYIPSGYGYSYYPIFHLIIVMFSRLSNLDYKYSAFITISLYQIFCSIIFIFFISNLIFKNIKIGLFSSMFMITGFYFITYMYSPIPNSLAITLTVITTYLIFKFTYINSIKILSLIFLLIPEIIMTHTIASLNLGLTIFSIWFLFYVYTVYREHAKFKLTSKIPLLFIIILSISWVYASNSLFLLSDYIRYNFSIDVFTLYLLDSNKYLNNVSLMEQLLNNIGIYLYYALSILGILYMISNKGNKNTFITSFLGLIPLTIGFYSILNRLFIVVERWWFFSAILLSIPLAMAFVIITNKKNKIIVSGFIFIFIFLFTFINMINPSINLDTFYFSPNTVVRYTFIKTEIKAASFITNHYQGKISSDFIYATSPSSSIFINYFELNSTDIVSLDDSLLNQRFNHDNTIKIIRTEIVNHPFLLSGSLWKLVYNPNNILINSKYNKIFDNFGVNAFI